MFPSLIANPLRFLFSQGKRPTFENYVRSKTEQDLEIVAAYCAGSQAAYKDHGLYWHEGAHVAEAIAYLEGK